ncbi:MULTISPECIES: porin family protein [unclassified Imperialibacter]|uniref:porin family protein n=1 Tax=unclassified Imperialibacter TaxID=2629706 RepID=UPI0012566D7D|nr:MULTISPECIES: porin family protein [unclassified Imperialibacter]CAD5252917.1 conserved exported hypothetical protein [Imperialibacter sp. 75]CAD5281163.1 conserved exported hypothetical protein [Imperialibacter sp. 89]VVT28961.1 conserved exported hypothetical protein [Imperialibacter sp. EC-SDR9]
MIKKTLFLLAIVALAASANAQDIKIGPRLGLTSSSIKVDKESTGASLGAQFESGDAKIGFQGGAFARLGIAGFYLQPELLFSATGGEIHVKDVSASLDETRELSFKKLDVPIMFGKKFAKIVRVNVGPSFSYLLKAESKVGDITTDVKNNYSNATVGFQAGAGLDLGPLILDVKYEGSLSKLGDAVGGYNTDQRQSMWVVALGFSFL